MILVLTIIISFRSTSLFFQWVGLEINILAIIPILINQGSLKKTLSSVKYFISQSPASIILVASLFTWDYLTVSPLIFQLSIFFKLALPPFHGWLVSILFDLDYRAIFMIFSVQKFIPLIILSQININLNLFTISSILIVFILLNLINLISSFHYLIFLSSLTNIYWLLATLSYNNIWLNFILIYTLIVGLALLCLSNEGLNKMLDLTKINLSGILLISLQFMNLGGIPPLLGFFLKLLIIKFIVEIKIIVIFPIIFITIILLFSYVSLIYQIFCINLNRRVGITFSSAMNVNIFVSIIIITPSFILLFLV